MSDLAIIQEAIEGSQKKGARAFRCTEERN
ncbi:Uncharacterised protein [Proteus vulgaris]|nr:Uncharacterised protein [Proteus vulgaris]